MKAARTAWVVAFVIACGAPVRVDVLCENDKDGLRCTVAHQQGNVPAKACWEVWFNCRNGTKARGGACQVVEPGSKAITRIPKTQIQGADKCDLITDSGVDNLTVGKPD